MQGIVFVARINFEDNVEKQEQFWKLIEIQKGDRDRVLGRLIRFFRIAQRAYGHDEPMTADLIQSVGLSDMIESGWAVPVPGGYQAFGAEKHFKWYRQRVMNGKSSADDADDGEDPSPPGGRPPVAPRPDPDRGRAAPPLSPVPVPVLSENTKIPDLVGARETRDQDMGSGPGAGIGLRPGEAGTGPSTREPAPLDFAAPELVAAAINEALGLEPAPEPPTPPPAAPAAVAAADPPPPARPAPGNVIPGPWPARPALEAPPPPPHAPDPRPEAPAARTPALPKPLPPRQPHAPAPPCRPLPQDGIDAGPEARRLFRGLWGAGYRPPRADQPVTQRHEEASA